MQSTYNIKSSSLGQAHETILKYILEKGELITTEEGELTLETGTICIFVEKPMNDPIFSKKSAFKVRFYEQYGKDLIFGTASEFEYDYHDRLFRWGKEGFNQIQYIINKLKTERESRRAIAITWEPPVDAKKKDVPCLQLIQCVIRHDLLHMKVVFRSNDMLSAASANMYGLVALQKHIASEIKIGVGSYTHISLIPHVYFMRDISDIPMFCEHGGTIQPLKVVCDECKGCYRYLVK
jgi:thymidylate synthase